MSALPKLAGRGLECGRTRHHHRFDAANTGIVGQGKLRAVTDLTDKPFWRQPDIPAFILGAALIRNTSPPSGKVESRSLKTAGRSPEQYMPALKAAGIKVIHKMHLRSAFAQGRTDRLRRPSASTALSAAAIPAKTTCPT